MEGLGIDIQQILFQVANFAILLFILRKFMYEPVLHMLDKRRAEVEEAAKVKTELEKRVEEIDTEREQMLIETKSEAEAILARARETGERMAKQIEISAKERADQIVAKGEESAARKEVEMREKLKMEVSKVAIDVAERVIGSALDSSSRQQITDESIKQFGSK